jgi:hypothetical protein
MTIASIAAFAATFWSADAVVDGHKLRIEKTSTLGRFEQKGRTVSHLSVTFAVDPKDPKKSFAYEIGQRFVARDVAGKEIPLGRVQSSGFREPAFRIAGYPSAPKTDPPFHMRDSMTVTIPLLNADVTSIAVLEGDLFVSDVETLEFTFDKNELTTNAIKKSGAAEVKLFLFDEGRRGVDIGFKMRLPVRSRADALAGGRGMRSEHFLLFATHEGRKSMLHMSGGGGGGGAGTEDDPRVLLDREFHAVELGGTPDALHLVIPHVESPRRHVFHLKDVPVPPPPPKKGPVAPKIG